MRSFFALCAVVCMLLLGALNLAQELAILRPTLADDAFAVAWRIVATLFAIALAVGMWAQRPAGHRPGEGRKGRP